MLASLLIAAMELPAFCTTLDSSSGESLRRFRIVLTCTRSLKSRELRKYVGLRRFIWLPDWWMDCKSAGYSTFAASAVATPDWSSSSRPYEKQAVRGQQVPDLVLIFAALPCCWMQLIAVATLAPIAGW